MKNSPQNTVRVLRLAQGGDGVAYLDDGRVVFVAGGLPGDEVELHLDASKKTWARGHATKIVTPSPGRIPSDCQHSDVCGGCSFRDYDYEAEFRDKVAAALETLARIGKADLEGVETHLHPAVGATGHRVRAQLHVKNGSIGYFERGTHSLFAMKECPALDPRLSAALPALRKFAADLGHGDLFVETASESEVVVSVDRGRATREACEALVAEPTVRGLAIERGRYGTVVVDSSEALGVATDIEVPPRRFRQANGLMSEALRAIVRERVGSGRVLDEFHAGSGNFTFALREQLGDIQAYEIDADAVALGNAVRDAIGMTAVRFRQIDLQARDVEIRPGAIVLLDPPRGGAERLCKSIAASSAIRVVYVSCDVATLARDLRVLREGGFVETSIDFVDMFPRTPHLEAVVVLKKSAQ